MTLNLLLITVTITRPKRTPAQVQHDIHVKQMMNELKERQVYYR
ncbi:YrzI family small protein [Ectobacillus sp. JY-23]|nr:YrzI family small protein [Ectobacillus sp. JY-23]UOY92201.1 YrzI family small protein [Ectobacillus sp. JY-23]